MTITAYLSEFSLPELFQFLEQGQKTGLLTINGLQGDRTPTGKSYYIWFRDGRIVAAANQLDGKGLISLIKQRKWHNEETLEKMGSICPVGSAWGLCLKSQGLLDADHLKILFSVQVLRQVCNLFTLEEGFFSFDSDSPLPLTEMTGLSTPANEVTLSGLRNLKDWKALQEKLPASSSGLLSIVEGKPKISLNQSEWQIWEFTKGNITLEKIALQLGLDLNQVQKIAFRLIVVGLVEEIPMLEIIQEEKREEENGVNSKQRENSEDISPSLSYSSSVTMGDTGLSQSFLDGLMNFLRNQ